MAQAAAADPAVGSMIYQDIGLRLFQVGQVWGAVKYLREAVRLRPEAVGDLEAHARSYENAADRLALAAICALLRGSDHEAVDLSERARDLARDVLADERRTGLYSALLFLLVSSRSNPTAFENMLESFGREGLRGG
jgi:tetratricopeptide (TPR) repeat protein